RLAAETIGIPFHAVSAAGAEIEREIPEILTRAGEPFGDSSLVPTWLLSRFAARGVKVVLSGDGGDELFAGYTRYQGERLTRLLTGVPAGALRRSAAAIRALASAAPVRARPVAPAFEGGGGPPLPGPPSRQGAPRARRGRTPAPPRGGPPRSARGPRPRHHRRARREPSRRERPHLASVPARSRVLPSER